MPNNVKWCLTLKLEDLKIPLMSLATRTPMATRAFSAGAEATVQRTDEVEAAIYTTFFRKLGSEENMREEYYQAVCEAI